MDTLTGFSLEERKSGSLTFPSTSENTWEDKRQGASAMVLPLVVFPKLGSLKMGPPPPPPPPPFPPPPVPKLVQASSAQWAIGVASSFGSRPKRGSEGCCWKTKKKPSGDFAVPPRASSRLKLNPRKVMSVGSVPLKIG